MNRKSALRVLGMGVMAAAILTSSLTPELRAETKEPTPTKLKVGDQAPDFKLHYFDGNNLKEVSLSQYRGKKNVALAFYIFAFTGG
jgi:AhpC/TSA family